MAKVEFLPNRCNDMRHYNIILYRIQTPLPPPSITTHTHDCSDTHTTIVTGSQVILYFRTIIIITHYNIIVWNLKFDKNRVSDI